MVEADYETEEADVKEDTDTGMCEIRGHSRKMFVSYPFSARTECPVDSKKDSVFKWLAIILHVLVSDCRGHSVFSGSHCACIVVNLEHHRDNENFVLG